MRISDWSSDVCSSDLSLVSKDIIAEAPLRRGRKKRWADNMQARFPDGTFTRIAEALAESEDRTDFVREAVERELRRRERSKRHVASAQAGTESPVSKWILRH